MADTMKDVEALQPFIMEFGCREVWEAGLHVLGFPPTWKPSLNDLIKLREYLIRR